MTNAIEVDIIAARIVEVRGKKVMLDSDLAKLYGVATKVLLQSVRRNMARFPNDFMYILTNEEVRNLRSQFVTSSLRFQFGTSSWGGRRYSVYVFTQEGVAMLSSVLNSERAIQVNILIMRAFVRMRDILLTHKELAVKIETLEKKYSEHDETIKSIFEAIKQLLQPTEEPKKRIGFHS